MSDVAPALPGLEAVAVGRGRRPGEVDMTNAKQFTGEVLFRDHPDVFKAVAAALFIDRMSIRSIAARYRVSVNTVRAIRDMAVEGATTDPVRAAFFENIKVRAASLRQAIRIRSLEALHDRLSDPDAVSKISVDTLIGLASLPDGDEDKGKQFDTPASAEVIDVDEFDAMINGLDGAKKSARENGADSADIERPAGEVERADDEVERADRTGEKCSTGSDDSRHAHCNRAKEPSK